MHSLSEPSEVHIWRIALDLTSSDFDVLSLEEQQRANRMKHEGTKIAFIRSHFALRNILSLYLKEQPAQINVRIQLRGKPEVDGIKFSLTHSANYAFLGVTKKKNIGIDIECMRPLERLDDFVKRFLNKEEQRDVLRSKGKLERFFEIWTAKEALAKATGAGLSGLEDAPHGLLVKPLIVPIGYVGAVAIEGSDMSLKYFDWM